MFELQGPLLRPRSPIGLRRLVLVLTVGLAVGCALGLGAYAWLTARSQGSSITVRATPGVLVAVRDLARLETTEVHIEKVIDLTDRQNHMFGLLSTTDAILLVAAGHATLGVDLGQLGPDDITTSADGKSVTLRLPSPKLLHAALDEENTYVYARNTSLLARRNEQLESKARREAVEAVKNAATTRDMITRAKGQAERQLRIFVSQLGPERVELLWQD